MINGVNIGAVTGSNNRSVQGANLVNAINARTAAHGVTASANAVTGALTLTSNTGRSIAVTTNNANAGANRLENATGLEVAGNTATRSINTVTFANGTAGNSTINVTTNVAAGDTLTVGGTVYTFVASGATGNQINVGAANTDTNNNIFAKLTGAVTNATVTQAGGAGTAITVTSNVMTAATAHHDVSFVTAAGAITNVDTAGTGAISGDTVVVGGVTYEFYMPNTTYGGSNVGVALGTSDAVTATNFSAAVTAQYAATNTNVQVQTTVGGVVTLRSDLFGSTALTGTEGVSTGTGNAVVIGAGTAGTDGTYAASTTHGTVSLTSSRLTRSKATTRASRVSRPRRPR